MRVPFWTAAALIAALAGPAAAQTPADGAAPDGAIRITSPLGRTGISATIRLVARVQGRPAAGVRVRFSVDGTPVGTADAPPFSVPWTDENPFEKREILAELEDDSGTLARDVVTLQPFEISDRTEIASVLLEAGVYDRNGRVVPGLPASAFAVLENGVPQAIDQVSTETLTSTIVLLVDNSQSLARNIDIVQAAVLRFARAIRKGDRVIVAPFNTRLGAITGPTDDPDTIRDAVAAMHASGGTAILDGLAESVRLLKGDGGRRIVILLTDGFDENSTRDVESVLAEVQSARVTVYGMGIGGMSGISLSAERALRPLVDQTGGRLWFSPGTVEIGRVADAIAADSHTRYLISYTPTNQKKDGAWRAISLVVPDGLKVRTRTGYQAASPPPIRPFIEFTVRSATAEETDLSADDLEVLEDGKPQAIDTFHEAVDPVAIVLALDNSGSMKKHEAVLTNAARQFVMAVRPEDRLALVTFADAPVLAHSLDAPRASIIKAIDEYSASGGTSLYDALGESLDALKPVSGRRAIVVLTDGRDENDAGTAAGSQRSFSDVLDAGRQVGAAIFAVGLGSGVDRDVLTRLAKESGGAAYFARDAADLVVPFQRIIEDLRRRYVISYASTYPEYDGRWRSVEIRPRVGGIEVSAPGGYFAPEP